MRYRSFVCVTRQSKNRKRNKKENNAVKVCWLVVSSVQQISVLKPVYDCLLESKKRTHTRTQLLNGITSLMRVQLFNQLARKDKTSQNNTVLVQALHSHCGKGNAECCNKV